MRLKNLNVLNTEISLRMPCLLDTLCRLWAKHDYGT